MRKKFKLKLSIIFLMLTGMMSSAYAQTYSVMAHHITGQNEATHGTVYINLGNPTGNAPGASVGVSAAPEPGYVFVGWVATDDRTATPVSTANPYTFVINANTTLYAIFNGDGAISSRPIEVATAAELAQLATEVNGGNNYSGSFFKMTADIDLDIAPHNTGLGWRPIGDNSSNDITTRFAGTFDGDGHKITGLFINRPGTNYVGLFGYVDGGEIENLGVEIHSGGVSGGSFFVGGLAGFVAASTVTSCYTTGGTISGNMYVGGLIGDFSGGTATSCYSDCDVTGTMNSLGGLIGRSSDGTISLCHATGNATGTNINTSRIGGFMGYSGSGTVTSCYSTGDASGSSVVGGFIGGCEANFIVELCYSTGNATGIGTTTGISIVGGFIGDISGPSLTAEVRFCYSTGNVSGGGTDSDSAVGGFMGRNRAKVTSCYSIGTVSGAGGNIGGFIGLNNNSLAIVTSCYSTGTISGSGTNIGGLIGNHSSSSSATLCYAEPYNTSDYIGSGSGTVANVSNIIGTVGSLPTANWDATSNDYPYLLILNHFHDVTFESVPGTHFAIATVNTGIAVRDTTATRTGYTFGGTWKDNTNAAWNFTTNVITQDTTLVATWTGNPYLITLDTSDGSTVVGGASSHGVTYGERVDHSGTSIPQATLANFVFGGWYDGTTLYADTTIYNKVAGNVNVTTRWDAEITYDTDGGSAIDKDTVLVGSGFVLPLTPTTKSGNSFVRWHDNSVLGSPFNAGNAVTQNITLYAEWEPAYDVAFNTHGGTPAVATQYVPTTGTGLITAPTTITRTGYTFVDWYATEAAATAWNFATDLITQDTTLHARWTANPYTITLDPNGGTVTPTTHSVTYDTAVGTLPMPVRAGFTFAGWFTAATGGTQYTATTPYTTAGAMTLHAQWGHIVTFDTHGGTTVASQTVVTGSSISTSPVTTRTGYTFNGWYTAATGGTAITFPLIVTANITIHAQWTATSTPPPPPTTVSVTGVSLNRTTLPLAVGKTETLSITVAPATATNKAVTWSSSNPAVATVSANGTVTAVAEGTATITVRTVDGGFTATVTITVTDPGVSNAPVDGGLFNAYPNPTDGIVTLTGITAGEQIRIYNLTGTQAATYIATTDGKMQIDLSTLPRGTYILKTTTGTVKVILK